MNECVNIHLHVFIFIFISYLTLGLETLNELEMSLMDVNEETSLYGLVEESSVGFQFPFSYAYLHTD